MREDGFVSHAPDNKLQAGRVVTSYLNHTHRYITAGMSEAGSVEKIRQYLKDISAQEEHLGIPVGCLLLRKTNFGVLKKSWRTQKLGIFGIKRFRNFSCTADYVVVHLSTQTAQILSLPFDDVIGISARELLQTLDGTFYPGVRVNDHYLRSISMDETPAISFPLLSPLSSRHVSSFTFAEIFAGIGGFRLGLELAGGTCLYASEIDSASNLTYLENFSSSETSSLCIGDITDTYSSSLPTCDILTAGFPCQSFSIRGEQRGLIDLRGQLYLELVRVLHGSKPKAFIFENVENLVYMGERDDKGYPNPASIGITFASILQDFESAGYEVTWNIINASLFLPQNRKRVYIVGFRNDLGVDAKKQFDWNLDVDSVQSPRGKTTGLHSTVRDILVSDDSEDIKHCELSKHQHSILKSDSFKSRVYPNGAPDAGEENWVVQLDRKAPTLVSSYRCFSSISTKFLFHKKNGVTREVPRFFTHLECLRLMGFPDDFKIPKSLAYNSFYKLIGNAVCPPIILSIGRKVLSVLGAPSHLSISNASDGDISTDEKVRFQGSTKILPTKRKCDSNCDACKAIINPKIVRIEDDKGVL